MNINLYFKTFGLFNLFFLKTTFFFYCSMVQIGEIEKKKSQFFFFYALDFGMAVLKKTIYFSYYQPSDLPQRKKIYL
jgi:hypothetical protein